jgi:hypothetical protein
MSNKKEITRRLNALMNCDFVNMKLSTSPIKECSPHKKDVMLEMVTKIGFHISKMYDPSPDGSCGYSAVEYGLSSQKKQVADTMGMYVPLHLLKFMEENPLVSDFLVDHVAIADRLKQLPVICDGSDESTNWLFEYPDCLVLSVLFFEKKSCLFYNDNGVYDKDAKLNIISFRNSKPECVLKYIQREQHFVVYLLDSPVNMNNISGRVNWTSWLASICNKKTIYLLNIWVLSFSDWRGN